MDPPHENMTELIDAMLKEVIFTPPFLFFGHSFGALLAYEVTHRLRDTGRALPLRLVLSGYPAPHLPQAERGLHKLPDSEFLRIVGAEQGGIATEVLANSELSGLVAGCTKADYRIAETYNWSPRPPLPVPFTIFGGENDSVSPEDLAAWEGHTACAPMHFQLFSGGHFFFREDSSALLREIGNLSSR